MLYASFGFLFYFFDVAWVFQRDFFTGADAGVGPAYALIMSLLMVLAGCGFLTSFWLLVCDYVGETRKALKVIPAVVFVAASVAVLLIVPEGGLRSFAFYSPRALYLFWMLAFAGAWYLRSKDAAERARLRRHLGLYGALWFLGLSVVVEDALVFLLPDPIFIGPRAYAPERNFAENALVLCCGFAACTSAWRSLSLRRTEPPTQGGASLETFIDQNLAAYAAARQLSKREAEVLRLVLLGKDNQNIATSMHLAPSTVKVHMHHILQKAERANRKELIQDFWEFS